MPLSWNEIKSRATAFSKEWADESSEDAEAKSFWDGFFNIFGISRRRVASFEQQVKKSDDKTGFIDLLWKGVILIEHKSRGKDLDRAYQQAKDYFPGLKEKELPRYILVSDFERFRLYDLEENQHTEFKLTDLVNQVQLFGFIAGYQKRSYKEQDPVNIEAAELMGQLHDKLKAIGYEGHQLELYLVRLLFLLFADDTNIFERGIFNDYLELKTNEDGADLAAHLSQVFEILNTPKEKRLKNLDESLAAFPYVNGKLFEEHLQLASFDSEMRRILLNCCLLDWGKISPAIFGSLFQSVMDAKARRNLGAHYTSEKNILKLIKPLFLDELWKEYEAVKDSKPKLQKFHDKISKLRFLDPACGCGNFLIIAYRELRLLEIEVIKTLLFKHEKLRAEVAADAGIDVGQLIKCDVDRFYGIEYEEFPAQIAQVAMWLIDHQMNQLVSNTFGEYYVRLPLRKSATIKHGNALRIDWQSLIDPLPWEKVEPRYHYILGNPPFIGKHLQNAEQKADMELLFAKVNGAGVLDYVAAWYIKAANYLQSANKVEEKGLSKTKVAFVSTNSISQGEQVGVLWNELFNQYHCKIHFAHRTFKWGNEAKGNAAVHVVIIGYSNYDLNEKLIYEYDDIKGEPHELKVKNINPYLVEGRDILVNSRSKAICNVPEIVWGNKPVDGGNLLFTDIEKKDFLAKEPKASKFFRPLLSAKEFLNGENRWCLWLVEAQPNEIREMPYVLEKIKKVKEMREQSVDEGARKLALRPSQFRDTKNPKSFILIPSATSENRKYIPFGFFNENYIANNSCHMIPDGQLFHFGVITSEMHMIWVKNVCGRLKSDYRYSKDIVYNNFPWPENPTDKQKEAVEKAAQAVLDARAQFPNSSLADLYDPNTMPPALVKAHQALDKAVDLCYRSQPFPNETKRIEFLFELYDKYTAGLFVKEKKGKRNKE
ncbi:MAG: class I SAM-dependent DNA methyltransferase [Bacteroidetes bacterium]|nr:class I SAM-dependent DNA methyltransferase [Bacteroidota bacterium]